MHRYGKITTAVCIAGIIISFYAYHVEKKKEEDANYSAMCDINEYISCTKAFSSAYGRGFGLLRHIVGEDSVFNQPNGLMGILFYIVFLGLDQQSSSYAIKLQLALSIISNLGSVYLAYILAFILHDFCFVCVATYTLNAILLYCVLKKRTMSASQLSSAKTNSRKDKRK